MAMNIGSGGGGRKRGRSALAAEINVTPFVDVMLVLLIVFMITAPLLQQGVDLNLPDHRAKQLPSSQETPVTVSIQADGKIYIQDIETPRNELIQKLRAASTAGAADQRVHVRADRTLPVENLTEVLAMVAAGGFTKVSIPTDPRAGVMQIQPTDTE